MRTKFLYIIGIVLSFYVLEVGQAQNAQSILDRCSSLFKGEKGIEFTYTVEGFMGQEMEEKTSGFIQLKGNKFYLFMPETEAWFNGKSLWVWMKDVGEVNISNPTEEELPMLSPFALLERAGKEFKVSLDGSGTREGKSIDRLVFVPEKASSDIKFMTLEVDRETSYPVQAELILNSGAKQKIMVSKVKKDIYLTDSHFEFNEKVHTGLEIIDLR